MYSFLHYCRFYSVLKHSRRYVLYNWLATNEFQLLIKKYWLNVITFWGDNLCHRYHLDFLHMNYQWPLWEPTSHGSHLYTQLRDSSRLPFPWTFSYTSFSSFTISGTPYRIFLLFLPWFPRHFDLVVIEQHQKSV